MAWLRRLTSLLLVVSFATAAMVGAAQAASATLEGERWISPPSPADRAPLGVPLDACETEKSESETESCRTLDAAIDGSRRWVSPQLAIAARRASCAALGGAPTDPIAAHAPRGPPLDA